MAQFALLVLVLTLVSCLPFAVAVFLALSSEHRAEQALRQAARQTPAAGQREAARQYARPGVGRHYSRFAGRIERTPPPTRTPPPPGAAPVVADPPPDHARAA